MARSLSLFFRSTIRTGRTPLVATFRSFSTSRILREHSNKIIFNFRSDTATIPTDEMFDIMKAASKGDDVLKVHEDTSYPICLLAISTDATRNRTPIHSCNPNHSRAHSFQTTNPSPSPTTPLILRIQESRDVNDLESYVASLCGHEDALFCVSGTMTNQLGIRSLLVQPPHSVLLDSRAHIFLWEAGGIAFHSQANVTPVVAKNGVHLTLEEVKTGILEEDVHTAPTRSMLYRSALVQTMTIIHADITSRHPVIALENTLNGMIFPLSEISRISEYGRSRGIKMHLDGARAWNASMATGIPLAEYGRHFDSMSLCLSKGIGAPIGSILVGSRDLIKRARHFRKLFGGGWRQAGSLAAVARHCLDTIWPTMPGTHALTRHLADSLRALGLGLAFPVMTNMVHAQLAPVRLTVGDIAPHLLQEDIRIAGKPDATTSRLVLHHQITPEAVETLIRVIGEVVRAKGKVVEKAESVEVGNAMDYPAAN
ncbi:pyridoxal phosphate-dependent transferase [Jimgerdemannia flammicorona]|uniref:Pyridoxal phosphate-dependent transferase n=1 Tax=Jimgerdemannia flammicorona TaxID=994334 RepID=A0A433DHL2_9FUNG|nr:pyridoxal phosphate-dependent transferase [Jimgerdemannia flammicorona]